MPGAHECTTQCKHATPTTPQTHNNNVLQAHAAAPLDPQPPHTTAAARRNKDQVVLLLSADKSMSPRSCRGNPPLQQTCQQRLLLSLLQHKLCCPYIITRSSGCWHRQLLLLKTHHVTLSPQLMLPISSVGPSGCWPRQLLLQQALHDDVAVIAAYAAHTSSLGSCSFPA